MPHISVFTFVLALALCATWTSGAIATGIKVAETETACNARCYKNYDSCRNKAHPKADPKLCQQTRSGCLKSCAPPYRR
jgi:hypothetical protein